MTQHIISCGRQRLIVEVDPQKRQIQLLKGSSDEITSLALSDLERRGIRINDTNGNHIVTFKDEMGFKRALKYLGISK